MFSQRKLSLKELVSAVNWEAIVNKNIGSAIQMNDDDIMVAYKTKPKSTKVEKVIIRVGINVMKTLGWKYKDRINVSNNKDDVLGFRLIKSEGGNGYKLKQQQRMTNGLIEFAWHLPEFPLRLRKSRAVEYYCPRDEYVVFRAEFDGEAE